MMNAGMVKRNKRFYDEPVTTPVTTPPAAAQTPPVTPAPAPTGAKFTQDDVNRMLAEDRRKHTERMSNLTQELETLKSKATLTDQERAALEGRLDQLRKESMTKEELLRHESAQAQREAAEKLQKLNDEAKNWKDRYETTLRTQEIATAAAKHGAYNAEQLALIVGPNTQIQDVLDTEGKPTGKHKVVASINVDGKVLVLPVDEAVAKLKGLSDYANLFKGGVPGTGARPPGSGSVSLADAAKQGPEAYRAARKAGATS